MLEASTRLARLSELLAPTAGLKKNFSEPMSCGVTLISVYIPLNPCNMEGCD
jgi:hypothetical protein